LCDALAAVSEPEVIAHHFAKAGLDEPAIEWWGKAGDQALHRSAYAEAIEHLVEETDAYLIVRDGNGQALGGARSSTSPRRGIAYATPSAGAACDCRSTMVRR
jgi:hypothetical protein